MSGTLAPAPAAAGSATITQVINNLPGPLSQNGYAFFSHGGPLVMNASGSGFLGSGNPIIGMNVFVDGVMVGTSKVYANNAGVHMAFVPIFVDLKGVGGGRHVIQLQSLNQTSTDVNDSFNVTVIEFQTA